MVSINLNLLKCRKNEKVINAINKLNSNGLQILLIINKKNNYVGTLTDGDIRRGLLNGLNLESEISEIVNYNSTLTQVTTQAASVDSSYCAAYWPWLQVTDPDSRELVWVPASTLLPGVYANNDRTAEA